MVISVVSQLEYIFIGNNVFKFNGPNLKSRAFTSEDSGRFIDYGCIEC